MICRQVHATKQTLTLDKLAAMLSYDRYTEYLSKQIYKTITPAEEPAGNLLARVQAVRKAKP